jgi:hypothetical protein
MAYFATTTNGGTVRFHDESELAMGVAPIAPVTPGTVTSDSTINALNPFPGSTLNPGIGNDHDLDAAALNLRVPEVHEYIPTRTELLQRHEISIQFMSVGCLVRIGCKSIPFESVEDAMKELNEYVNNPHKSIKKWEKILGK